MKDYFRQQQEVKDFINDRLIITKKDEDSILCCDIHYFINLNRDYRDTITYRTINVVLSEYEDIYKKSFSGSMNVIGLKWKTIQK